MPARGNTCACGHAAFLHCPSRRSPGNHCRSPECGCRQFTDADVTEDERAEIDRQAAEHQRFIEETPFGRWLAGGRRRQDDDRIDVTAHDRVAADGTVTRVRHHRRRR